MTGSEARPIAVAVVAAIGALLSLGAAGPPLAAIGTSPAGSQPTLAASASVPPEPAILVGAGDIAACGSSGAKLTAGLLDTLAGTVFAAGDLAYPDGTSADFADCFGPTWGRFTDRMIAVPGNHEYHTPGAEPYFDWFGGAAGTTGTSWYATDVGSWRVYALDANCDQVDCGPGSEQLRWLEDDLAHEPRACVAAIWHQPRWSSGPHGDDPATGAFWEALYRAGAELILNGHEHLYERFAALAPDGTIDADHGLTEIIAGTGGVGHYPFLRTHPGSLVRDDSGYGVLRLELGDGEASWQYLPADASTFTDDGHLVCHGPPEPTAG